MWLLWSALVLAGGILSAQTAPDEETARRQRARDLLEKVDTSLGALSPEVNLIVLAQVAAAWKPLDNRRAVSYIRQAFGSASALPDDSDRPVRSRMQAEIVKMAVDISLPEAADLLHGMPSGNAANARNEAADRVVDAL